MAATLLVTDRPGSVELPAIGLPSSTPGSSPATVGTGAPATPDGARGTTLLPLSGSCATGTYVARWPPSRRSPSGTASTPCGCAPRTTAPGRRCATTWSPGCPGCPRHGSTPCWRAGLIVGRDGPVGPRDAVPAAGVPVVPPRPARRGAGAVRPGRPAPRRRVRRGGQAALPRDDPARPAHRRDRAGAAAPRAGPARAVARAPARPGDGRRAAVRGAPRPPRGVPDAVPRPAGAQDLRGRRPVRPGGAVARGPCAAGSSRSAG